MLLSNLKKVEELDNRIVQIHRELTDLYQQRYLLIDGSNGLSSGNAEISRNTVHRTLDTAEQEYRQLAAAWERYDIIMPAFNSLKAKLRKASRITDTLRESYPEIADQMRIVAVPPSRYMTLPISVEMREVNGGNLPDFISPSVKLPKQQKVWELLLVFCGNESLRIGTAKKLKKLKGYMLAGYDMRDMGIREYAAVTLQQNGIIDQSSSTVLLKTGSTGKQIPCARFSQGRYRIEMEDEDNVLEDDGFRPAIKL